MANIQDELLDVIETKVRASTTAATITGLLLSVLGLYVFKGATPDWAQVAVTAIVGGGLMGLSTFIAGYRARHTPRTPPTPKA
jgi:hypothetical protein